MILQCRVCKGLWSEERMASEDLCVRCEAREYLKNKGGDTDVKKKLKKQGDKGLPGKGERSMKNQAARSGQMTLPL